MKPPFYSRNLQSTSFVNLQNMKLRIKKFIFLFISCEHLLHVRCFLIPMTYKAGCELSREWYPPWEEQCESWDKHIKMTGL